MRYLVCTISLFAVSRHRRTVLVVYPVLDTSNLAAVASLPDVPVPDADTLSPDTVHARFADLRLASWVRDARVLAAAGVRPAPSHVVSPDGKQYASAFGAFHDALEISASAGHPAFLLVLGFVLERSPRSGELQIPPLPAGYPWLAIANQTTGILCRQVLMAGLPLQVRPEALPRLERLAAFADRNGHDCVGLPGLSLSELREYHGALAEVGLSAELNYRALAEGCYPFEASDDLLAALTSSTVPAIEDFLTLLCNPGALLPHLPRPSDYPLLALLTENCD
jgi:hypothetical protein